MRGLAKRSRWAVLLVLSVGLLIGAITGLFTDKRIPHQVDRAVSQLDSTAATGDTAAARSLQLSFQLGAAYGMFATLELQRRGQQVFLSDVWSLADSLRAAGWRP